MDIEDFRAADPECQRVLLDVLRERIGPRPDLRVPDAHLVYGLRLDELPIRRVGVN